jgi:cyclophilin family peptidyl-prolyl cis-trans isomerase
MISFFCNFEHKIIVMKNFYLSLIFIFIVGFQPALAQKKAAVQNKKVVTITELKQKAIIHTSLGDITILLYDKTPLHRDNFIKLANEKYYDSTLFHRVIPEFMIQGGDPDSKKALPGTVLGDGGPEYTIKAEFVPELIHKKGALCAARMGDNVNPNKESSGSQFYIVQGKKFSVQELTNLEMRFNQAKRAEIANRIIANPPVELKAKVDSARAIGTNEAYSNLVQNLEPIIETELAKQGKFAFTEEQKKVYSTIGGAPHLDGGYTVFGEVISGLEVVEKIAALPRDKSDRPLTDIKMTIELIK